MTGSIFLPLRSNAAFFETADARDALERRLKTYLIAYDSIAPQDGRYSCTIWAEPRPSVWATLTYPEKKERSTIQYVQAGAVSTLAVQVEGTAEPPRAVAHGPLATSYEIDFFPILNDAGIANESYVEWIDGDLSAADKRRAERLAAAAGREPGVQGILEGQRERRAEILKALHIDSSSAVILGRSMGADPHVQRALAWSVERALAAAAPDPVASVARGWMGIHLPDFSLASWSEVHDIRQSAAGRDLRKTLRRVGERLDEVLSSIDSEKELDEFLAREFVAEAAAEAASSVPAIARVGGAVMIDLGLNWLGALLAAPAPLITAAAATYELIQRNRQWYSLVHWTPEASRPRTLDLR